MKLKDAVVRVSASPFSQLKLPGPWDGLDLTAVLPLCPHSGAPISSRAWVRVPIYCMQMAHFLCSGL